MVTNTQAESEARLTERCGLEVWVQSTEVASEELRIDCAFIDDQTPRLNSMSTWSEQAMAELDRSKDHSGEVKADIGWAVGSPVICEVHAVLENWNQRRQNPCNYWQSPGLRDIRQHVLVVLIFGRV